MEEVPEIEVYRNSIKASPGPQMFGVKYDRNSFKETCETFFFDGTWDSFHTNEETPSEHSTQ